MSGNVIILEEFAFMNKHCWFEVVVPLIALRETATIAITTLSPAPDNHVADLIARKVFKVWTVKLVCEACERAGVTDRCDHLAHLAPQWQSEGRRDVVRDIYGDAQRDKYSREMQGIVQQRPSNCFSAESIAKVFDGKRYILERDERYLFVIIDPSPGSVKPAYGSDFAMMTFLGPDFRIVGCEAIETRNMTSWENRIVDHLVRCYSIPEIANTKLVVFIEGNMKTEAYHAKRMIRSRFPYAVFPGTQGDDEQYVGFITTNQTKHDCVAAFQIALDNGLVKLPRSIVTTDPNPEALLLKLRAQLGKFSRFAIPGNHPLQPTRYTFTGKSSNMEDKDDLAMVALMGYKMCLTFFTTRQWAHYM